MGSKMWEIKLQKIVEDTLRKLYPNGTVIYKFLAVLMQKKILGYICLNSEQIIHRKQSLVAPDNTQRNRLWSFMIWMFSLTT